MKTLASILISSLLSTLALAQPAPAEVRVSVQPERVKLGEPFEHTISLRHPLSYRYELVAPKDAEPFVLIKSRRTRQDSPQDSVTTFTLQWALFEVGEKTLPTLTFQVATPEGPAEFQVPGNNVEGLGTLKEDDTSLVDIRPPEEVRVPSWRIVYWALGTLAGLLAIATLIYFLLKRQKKPAPAPPPLSLHERTFRALNLLRQEALAEKQQVREFYFRLSEIVREYLGERLGFDALECTTPELLEALRQRPIPGLSMNDMERFAHTADLARYAKAPVSLAECHASLEFAYQMLKDTPMPRGET